MKLQVHIGPNQMVERYVQTVEEMLKKVDKEGKDSNLALLAYRNSPIDKDIKSPNEIMFNRKVRGIIPLRNINDKKTDFNDMRNKLLIKQNNQKMYFDNKAHVSKDIKVDDTVFVKGEMNKPLVPGVVISKCNRPRSYKMRLNNNSENNNETKTYKYLKVTKAVLIIL